MEELTKSENSQENAYQSIRGYVIEAQRQVYSAVNTAMVSLIGISVNPFMNFAAKMAERHTASRYCSIYQKN